VRSNDEGQCGEQELLYNEIGLVRGAGERSDFAVIQSNTMKHAAVNFILQMSSNWENGAVNG
jgi:hypothetical protein